MATERPTADESDESTEPDQSTDDAAVDTAVLDAAVHDLRAAARRSVPFEFAAMSMARLLEEISRALADGAELPPHLVDAATEIAQHTVGHARGPEG